MAKKKDTITAKERDRRFDGGEDISAFLDWKTATRPGLEQRRVNVDLPFLKCAPLIARPFLRGGILFRDGGEAVLCQEGSPVGKAVRLVRRRVQGKQFRHPGPGGTIYASSQPG